MDVKRLATLDVKEHLTVEEYIEWQRLRQAKREEEKAAEKAQIKRVVLDAPAEVEPPGFVNGKWRGEPVSPTVETKPEPGSAAYYSRHHYIGHIRG